MHNESNDAEISRAQPLDLHEETNLTTDKNSGLLELDHPSPGEHLNDA